MKANFKNILVIAFIIISLDAVNNVYAQEWEQNFINPPQSFQALTWWHWINGNVTKNGITKDLEAMKTAGVGGAIMFNVEYFPKGEVQFMSETWWDKLGYAMNEADRLGLKFGVFNCDGWGMSGGPWIEPEESMKKIVWADTTVVGGREIELQLSQPTIYGIYHDIAILAFPALTDEKPLSISNITNANQVTNKAALIDNDNNTTAWFLSPIPQNPASLVLDLGKIKSLRRAVVDFIKAKTFLEACAIFEYSTDGSNYKKIDTELPLNLKFPGSVKSMTLSFPEIHARFIKLTVKFEYSGLTPNPDDTQDSVGINNIKFFQSPRINFWEAKSGQSQRVRHDRQQLFMKELNTKVNEQLPSNNYISSNEIINLTDIVNDDGKLFWNVPEGNWIIQRIGYTSTGVKNKPATEEGRGLECDKMSVEATKKHFNGYVEKVITFSKKTLGRPLDFVQMESWEAGIQNWTSGFEHEFERRNGYSIISYLPVMAGGRVVNSYEESNRFLWDLRKTVANLISENYWGTMYKLCKENGVQVLGEGSGMQQFLYDPIIYHKENHIPMGEFWTSEGKVRADCKNAASVAHTYGKELVAAESFTGTGDKPWRLTPYDLKQIGDEAFTLGVNQFVLHSYVHQPYDIGPGFTLGRHGNHFQRHNPWYLHAQGWFNYIARSQYLLRQGEFVADLCYFTGEGIPGYLGLPSEVIPKLPEGYDYDGVNLQLIQNMNVVDGKLLLPSGASYHMLIFQELTRMTPDLAREVKRLVKSGATIVAPKPLGSPSLSNYPQCDEEVTTISDEVWGDIDGKTVKEQKFGKGRVIWGIPLSDLLSQMNNRPDFSYSTDDSNAKINYIHRKFNETDIYFIANHHKKSFETTCQFRINNKIPELWDPDKGSIEKVFSYSSSTNGISIPLRFESYGSKFIIFRKKIVNSPTANSIEKEYTKVKEINIKSSWKIKFSSQWNEPEETFFDQLVDWTKHELKEINFFSGSATYSNTFHLDSTNNMRFMLNLGEVKNLAKIIVNGYEVANLWKPPFEVDISNMVKKGENLLKVIVTNTATNQMIGDEQLPSDYSESSKEFPEWLYSHGQRKSERKTFVTYQYFDKNSKLEPSGLMGPVKIRISSIL